MTPHTAGGTTGGTERRAHGCRRRGTCVAPPSLRGKSTAHAADGQLVVRAVSRLDLPVDRALRVCLRRRRVERRVDRHGIDRRREVADGRHRHLVVVCLLRYRRRGGPGSFGDSPATSGEVVRRVGVVGGRRAMDAFGPLLEHAVVGWIELEATAQRGHVPIVGLVRLVVPPGVTRGEAIPGCRVGSVGIGEVGVSATVTWYPVAPGIAVQAKVGVSASNVSNRQPCRTWQASGSRRLSGGPRPPVTDGRRCVDERLNRGADAEDAAGL